MKLWGGRFVGKTDPVMERFNSSIGYDRAMWKEDLFGSEKYVEALARCGIVTSEECQQICRGLGLIREEWSTGVFSIHPSDEDIHTANERRLIELVGSVGGKLHTGRSRNDQVVTDLRLWLRGRLEELDGVLRQCILMAAHYAEQHIDCLQAGFTHLQPAQPIRHSHWMLSHAMPLLRDLQRLQEIARRVNICPLGSGALAGHPFGIDRNALAAALGFRNVSLNSLDATSDRDFVAETLQWASLLMVHLSQFAEDAILLNLRRTIRMSDAYCTGSSLMPQKRNPDALELLRGKTGRVLGHATGLLTTLKGLPRAYNKDLQEDKEALFDSVSTVHDCLLIFLGILSTMQPVEKELQGMLCPEMLATDLAEYLVRKGVPFRETHHIAGQAVKLAEEKAVALDQLDWKDLQALHAAFDEDVVSVWSYEHSVESRDSIGGTSKRRVQEAITNIRERLSQAAGLN